MRISILGTGIMGTGVARSLLREGLDVTVWNRSRERAEPLAEAGAVVADTPAEAMRDADVVLTTLYDGDSVLEVMREAAASVAPDTVWMQCSTVGIRDTARAAALADEHGIRLLDAPMLGTKTPAEQGNLVMLVSGDPDVIERVQPVLAAMGSRVVNAGAERGQATALKLATNAWIQTITAAVAQSLALARGLGIDPKLFLEAIGGGATDSPYAHVKGSAMLEGDYAPSFALDGVIKDLGLIESAARAAGVDESLLEAVRAAYEHASDAGHGADDMAAVFAAFTRNDDPFASK